MEHPDYRPLCEMLNMEYPGVMVFTAAQAMKILNVKSRTTLYKLCPMNKGRISKPALIRTIIGVQK